MGFIYHIFRFLNIDNHQLWTLSCELLNSFSCVTIAYLYVESLYRELYKLTIYMMHIASALYIDTQISLRQCFFSLVLLVFPLVLLLLFAFFIDFAFHFHFGNTQNWSVDGIVYTIWYIAYLVGFTNRGVDS